MLMSVSWPCSASAVPFGGGMLEEETLRAFGVFNAVKERRLVKMLAACVACGAACKFGAESCRGVCSISLGLRLLDGDGIVLVFLDS